MYDSKSGSIDTNQPGEYQFTIKAQDEAVNEGKLGFTVKVKDIVYLNADNPTPIVYEGKTVLSQFSHVHMVLSRGFNNMRLRSQLPTAPTIRCLHGYMTYILMRQEYKHIRMLLQIAAGKNGDTHSYIEEEDLTEEMKDFSEAEATFCMRTSAWDKAKDSRIIMINRNAIQ